MHPSFVLSGVTFVVTAIVSALPSSDAASAQADMGDYAVVMAAVTTCGLDVDMAKAGQWLIDNGLAPTNQEQTEKMGKMIWEEGQRIYQMTTAEQTKHCAEMRAMVASMQLR